MTECISRKAFLSLELALLRAPIRGESALAARGTGYLPLCVAKR